MASNPKLLQYIEDKIKALIEVRMGNVKEIVVDDALSATSENPVQNKVIKAAIDAASGGGGSVTVDTAMSDSSTNPVQNKVIKSYVDEQAVTVDSALDSTSENPVQNKAITNEITTLSANTPKVYRRSWAQSINFTLPIGRQALVIRNASMIVLLWNPASSLSVSFIYGSQGVSFFERDDEDTTSITCGLTTSTNSTWTAIVF